MSKISLLVVTPCLLSPDTAPRTCKKKRNLLYLLGSANRQKFFSKLKFM